MVHVSRLAEELILWSSAEFAFIRLPDAFATGSQHHAAEEEPRRRRTRARPHRPRHRRARQPSSRPSRACRSPTTATCRRTSRRSSTPRTSLLPTLAVFAEMLPRIVVDADRMAAAAVANYSLATDLADYLAQQGPARSARRTKPSASSSATPRAKGVELHELPLADYAALRPLFDEGRPQDRRRGIRQRPRRPRRHRPEACPRRTARRPQAHRSRYDEPVGRSTDDRLDARKSPKSKNEVDRRRHRRTDDRALTTDDQARPLHPHRRLRPPRRPDPRGRGGRRRLHPPRRHGRPLRPADHLRPHRRRDGPQGHEAPARHPPHDRAARSASSKPSPRPAATSSTSTSKRPRTPTASSARSRR